MCGENEALITRLQPCPYRTRHSFDGASTQLPCGSGRVSVMQMGVDAPAADPGIRVHRVATGFEFNHRPRRASLGKQRTGSALSDERNDVTAGKWSLQLGYEILV